ncbi:MAG: nitrate reductase maturation protein NarM [Leptolyngbya sp. SIO4C1]|nr:nitrate reductase maturation protein NarM [Leptolyngbya sp. SIO4C1]
MAASDCFLFEQDFVNELQCIPMAVRLKLDTCGVKLKLNHWHRFSLVERQVLLALPCDSGAAAAAYREHLQTLVTQHTGAPAKDLPVVPQPAWHESSQVPTTVQQQAAAYDQTVSAQQWAELTPLQRFALIKLSQPGHENRNFLPALQEFGLA